MLHTRKTTNFPLIREFMFCGCAICRPLIRDIEKTSHEWISASGDYPEIRDLMFLGIDMLSDVSYRSAMKLCLSLIFESDRPAVYIPLFTRIFDLQKKLPYPEERLTVLEQIAARLDNDGFLSAEYTTPYLTDWADTVRKLPDVISKIDAVKRAVGFTKDTGTGGITIAKDSETLRNTVSMILKETLPFLDDADAVPTITDLSRIAEGTSVHREMTDCAAAKLNTLEKEEDRVLYASLIIDRTDSVSARNKAAVSILENIDALPVSAQKLSLIIKAAMIFEPRSEMERKTALKWAEAAIQTRLRTSVPMEEIMTEAMQAPDNGYLKEQALQLAVSLSAVLLKQQWMSEREKGLALALSVLPYTRSAGLERLREKAVDILLDNADVLTKIKNRAHFVYDVAGYAVSGSPQGAKAVSLLLETSENMTNTTRFVSGEPSENDLCLIYMYRAAGLLADGAADEQAVIGKWSAALKSLPTNREKIAHLIRCLKETPRERLLYTVAFENYELLTKKEDEKREKSGDSSSSGSVGHTYLRVVGGTAV